jgi:hypothetical protein
MLAKFEAAANNQMPAAAEGEAAAGEGAVPAAPGVVQTGPYHIDKAGIQAQVCDDVLFGITCQLVMTQRQVPP